MFFEKDVLHELQGFLFCSKLETKFMPMHILCVTLFPHKERKSQLYHETWQD